MTDHKIKAVAFDVDGTMYANSHMYLRNAFFGLANFSLLKALKAVREAIRDDGDAIVGDRDFFEVQAGLVAAKLNQNTELVKIKLTELIYHKWEADLKGISLVKGFLPLVEGLKKESIKLGVLSDFPVGKKLQILGIEAYWDFALGSESVGRLKPHPRPFEKLAEGLGLEPGQILFVGNSYRSDVIGAKKAGFIAAHFARRAKKTSKADYTFTSYLKLGEWIFKNT